MQTDYQKKAEDFIQAHGITFTAVLIGSDCPMFCEDEKKHLALDEVDKYPRRTHIHGKHYRCTFTRTAAHCNGAICARYKPLQCQCKCTLCHASTLVIDFWNSYADEEFNALGSESYRHGETPFKYRPERGKKTGPRKPTPYDVLACIQKHHPGTFEEFCSEFGYDTDSRRAEQVYDAVCDQFKQVDNFFTESEIDEMGEIN